MKIKKSLYYLLYRFFKELFQKKASIKDLIDSLKFLPEYIRLNKKSVNALGLGMPLITFKSLEYLKNILDKDMLVFEYGSGGSTIFLSSKVKKVISIEHDINWYERLNVILNNNKIENVKLELHSPQESESPKIVSLSDERFLGLDYFNYVNSISEYPDNYFDLVIIDGRARLECLKVSLKKIKPKGYLLFDNSNRDHYKTGLFQINDNCVCRGIGPVISTLMFSETKIFRI